MQILIYTMLMLETVWREEYGKLGIGSFESYDSLSNTQVWICTQNMQMYENMEHVDRNLATKKTITKTWSRVDPLEHCQRDTVNDMERLTHV